MTRKGGAAASVEIIGLEEALAALTSYTGPELDQRIRQATLAGAQELRDALIDAAPPHARSGSRYPSDLRGSTLIRARRQDGQWTGYVVGPLGKQGWVRNFVIGGAKPHIEVGAVGTLMATPYGPRRYVHHPGQRPNPYVQRVGESDGDVVLAAVAAQIARS